MPNLSYISFKSSLSNCTVTSSSSKKVRIQKKINNSREYLIVANRISGQKRIESREKINKLLAEKNKRVTTLKEEHENGEQSYKYNN